MTLEEIFTGCTRNEKICIKIFDKNGSEINQKEKMLTFNILPGAIAKTRIPFDHEGDEYYGKKSANVVFIISELEHDYFKTNGNDLEFTANLTLKQFHYRQVTVPNIEPNGDDIEIIIDDTFTQNTVHRLSGHGLPFFNGNGKRGDLLVKFKISGM